ncbi:hypothetical protein HETIRDRAFT_436926 [Heterobasidion irregulare TC 32-1]|uniref:T6SS Phospholipase effector Tle1-like catalytic domain-containing protein n=1 Tax=Heterobasidion irregulare (strain TC 32-1) TaxID=747525 RepID=W4JRF2_HETIT|nr:uncharacterized protein HETIRDRAFT_436926 [Heterobasidion irregulare TC 32-1]ETW76152.1 hypothetical protein HETIRDRAFT_436926 [Heterobasidion irregulare TC 32-1]
MPSYVDREIQTAHTTVCDTCKRRLGSRSLIVCLDGTSNKIGAKNTFVVQLCDHIEKDWGVKFDPVVDPKRGKCCPRKQMTYYSSGIGTYAATQTFKLPIAYLMQKFRSMVDLAFAWHFEVMVMKAYQWLSNNYEPDDDIYLFGFSRGAYQVRTLAGMINKVGLIYAGNVEQIPFAYEQAIRKDEDFNKVMFRPVKIQFVGVWDTVSSIGPFRHMSLPLASLSQNVKYYRHALALDERRVKFLAEYLDDKVQPEAASKQSKPDVKEVWFVGTHSDVGGGNETGVHLPAFSVDWMIQEAEAAGLRFHAHEYGWNPEELFPLHFLRQGSVRSSVKGFWRPLEYLPISAWQDYRIISSHWKAITTVAPHRGQSRRVLPSQKIHISVKLWYRTHTELPKALKGNPNLFAHLTRVYTFGIPTSEDNYWELRWLDRYRSSLLKGFWKWMDDHRSKTAEEKQKDDDLLLLVAEALRIMASTASGFEELYNHYEKFEELVERRTCKRAIRPKAKVIIIGLLAQLIYNVCLRSQPGLSADRCSLSDKLRTVLIALQRLTHGSAMDPHTGEKIELDCLRIVSFLLFHPRIRNTMVQMEELRWVRDESLLKKVPFSTRVNLVAATSMAHWEHRNNLKHLTTATPRVIAAVVILVEEEEVIIHAEDYRSKLPRKVTPENLQDPNHKMAIILRNIYFASNHEENRQNFVKELVVEGLPGFIQTVCCAVSDFEGDKSEEVFAIGALALACLKRLASYADTQKGLRGPETGEALLQALKAANDLVQPKLTLPWAEWIGAFTFQATSIKAMGEMLSRLNPSWVIANRDELVVQLDRAIECTNGREMKTKQQAHIRQLADAKGRAEAALQFLERIQAGHAGQS